jgi:hypothetical protein
MSIELAIGQFLTLSQNNLRFQNYYLNKSMGTPGNPGEEYAFLPFGFSGVTVNRSGDNIEAELVFANQGPARSWATQAIRENWICGIQSWIIEPDPMRLFRYVGQISAGGWDQAQIVLKLNSVLDAVGNDFPQRVIDEQTVGLLPTSSRVRV